MGSYIKASMERSYAESFLAELERNDNQYFLFIGKGTTWANENSPPAYTDSVASEYQVMNDIIGYKKLSPENVLFAIPRYEWISGTVYDQYSDTTELFSENNPQIFYVVTDENKIYKCLSNNNGAPSTVKPTPVITSPFTTSDNYRWKYLSTVRESDLPYELTDYVPVDFAKSATDTETQNQYNSQIDAINSSITRINVQNGSPAAKYLNTVYSTDNSPITLNVGSFSVDSTNSSIKYVRITDPASRTKITTLDVGTVTNNYVGYVLRVNASTVNPKEVNNYGIITAINVQSNYVEFTVRNDVVDFVVTPSTTTSDYSSVHIIPYVKIVGSGSGAYAFPVMKADKTIQSIDVVNGGRGYSNATARVTSFKQAGTVDPTVGVVLSPKGGHGSNILKELNVKDVLIVVKVGEYDAAKIRGGGKYRQFGIIKNPVLSDGTARVAGKENLNYRNISLVPVDQFIDVGDFGLGVGNIIIGSESYASAKPVSVNSKTSSRILLKTLNTSGKFITTQDRLNDYALLIGAVPSPFSIGETVRQIVPAGTVIGSGISYGYDLVVEGRVVEYQSGRLSVRLSSGGNFVRGKTVTGLVTGVTASVLDTDLAVTPRYGELVWISQGFAADGESLSFRTRNFRQKLYRINEVSEPYFDLENTPSYSGLHVLNMVTSISGICAGTDTTSAPITRTAFVNGQFVQQGTSAGYGNYAYGQVFDWEYISPSSGRLYLTDVVGSFQSVETHGLTGTQLGEYIIASVNAPEIDRTSGEVIYINNVRPITRATGQEEEFRLRLGF